MLRKLEDGEPVLRLKRLLKQAAAEESFEVCSLIFFVFPVVI